MKTVVAACLAGLLFLGSLIPQNDLGELTKLPQLLEHYHFHHSAAGGGLSLLEFLVEHYGSGTKHHFDCTFSAQHQQDHQNLPLHGPHHGAKVDLMAQPPRLTLVPVPHRTWTVRIYRLTGQPQVAYRPAAVLLQPPRA